MVYLRGTVGVHQVVVGTSDHNHSIHQSLHVENNAAWASLMGMSIGSTLVFQIQPGHRRIGPFRNSPWWIDQTIRHQCN